jgi:hypothetical protein
MARQGHAVRLKPRAAPPAEKEDGPDFLPWGAIPTSIAWNPKQRAELAPLLSIPEIPLFSQRLGE